MAACCMLSVQLNGALHGRQRIEREAKESALFLKTFGRVTYSQGRERQRESKKGVMEADLEMFHIHRGGRISVLPRHLASLPPVSVSSDTDITDVVFSLPTGSVRRRWSGVLVVVDHNAQRVSTYHPQVNALVSPPSIVDTAKALALVGRLTDAPGSRAKGYAHSIVSRDSDTDVQDCMHMYKRVYEGDSMRDRYPFAEQGLDTIEPHLTAIQPMWTVIEHELNSDFLSIAFGAERVLEGDEDEGEGEWEDRQTGQESAPEVQIYTVRLSGTGSVASSTVNKDGRSDKWTEPSRTMLDTSSVHYVFCLNSVYVWCGSQSPMALRSASALFAERRFRDNDGLDLFTAREGVEPVLFTLLFPDWDTASGTSSTLSSTSSATVTAEGAVRERPGERERETGLGVPSMLRWPRERGRQTRMPGRGFYEHGYNWYTCHDEVYTESAPGNLHSFDVTVVASITENIVYIWLGQHSSPLSHLTANMTLLPSVFGYGGDDDAEEREREREMGGGRGGRMGGKRRPTVIVEEDGQESQAFLSLCPMMVHVSGKSTRLLTHGRKGTTFTEAEHLPLGLTPSRHVLDTVSARQGEMKSIIETECVADDALCSVYQLVRAPYTVAIPRQVLPVSYSTLSSHSTYIVIPTSPATPTYGYLWVGTGCLADATTIDLASLCATECLHISLTAIVEGAEPPEFITLLGGNTRRERYSKVLTSNTHPGYLPLRQILRESGGDLGPETAKECRGVDRERERHADSLTLRGVDTDRDPVGTPEERPEIDIAGTLHRPRVFSVHKSGTRFTCQRLIHTTHRHLYKGITPGTPVFVDLRPLLFIWPNGCTKEMMKGTQQLINTYCAAGKVQSPVVLVTERGEEPYDFRACFSGWTHLGDDGGDRERERERLEAMRSRDLERAKASYVERAKLASLLQASRDADEEEEEIRLYEEYLSLKGQRRRVSDMSL
ncbi:hypothetical protein KIPB_008148 [Kipferlia bialata]|uniref:Gelsolin-like domain-containing protein n=1 Tax=Kipferlia bialata TaxID=797122 RepID=A0A9K3D1G6_9EUKA|nr:hypothetical protein KIPB_008148 [Kipferlia bialata]|eukprot:g8148.t1